MDIRDSWHTESSFLLNYAQNKQFDLFSATNALAFQMLGILLVSLAWAVSSAYFGVSTITTIAGPIPTTPSTITTTPTTLFVMFELQIEDALNGDDISGALVTIQSDVNRQIFQAETDSNGLFVVSGWPIREKVKVTVEKDGYISVQDNIITTSGTQSDSARVISMAPAFEADGSKFMVLNWGPYPVDLDAYVLQIDKERSQVDCVVFWANTVCENVRLERDVGDGKNGAESVTWENEDEFDYAIVINYFSGSEEYPLINTEAKLTIYGVDGFTSSVDIPQEEPSPQSRYWIVGCVNGSKGASSFREINEIVAQDPVDDSELCSMI